MFFAEFGAQAANVHIYSSGATEVFVPPHARQQCLARKNLARVLRQEFEQLVLHVREVEWLPAKRCLVSLEVEYETAVFNEHLVLSSEFSPKQMTQAGF